MRTITSLSFTALLVAALACDKSSEKPPSSKPDPHESKGDAGDKGDQDGDQDGDGDEGAEQVACGGIAGTPCPEGMTCVDDPADDCDPAVGGRDCMGMCVLAGDCNFEADPNKRYVGKSPEACATMRFTCDDGEEYFSDDCGCGCAG